MGRGSTSTASRLALCGALLLAAAPARSEVGNGQEHRRVRRRGFRLEADLAWGVTTSCDLRETLRYTPVTGLQPGLLCTWRRPIREGRGDLVLDTAFAPDTGAGGDLLLGPRLRLASGPLAEIGAQYHALTDSNDTWRTPRLQSALSFALQNRPDAEFFRREGFTAFVTTRPLERLLLGVEYRLDEYSSLASREGVSTLPEDDEIVFQNHAIEAGRIGSLVLRGEWSSGPVASSELDSVFRHTDLPLASEPTRTGILWLRSLNTLEIARPELGGDERFAFTRLVSDNALVANQGALRGLRLRLRLGADWGEAPPQKQETLGGWSALRGPAFNRYRGNLSILGVAEYRYHRVAAFVDAGAVRERVGWSGLVWGVGGRVYLWCGLNLGAAWNPTGAGGGAFPSVRVLLSEGW